MDKKRLTGINILGGLKILFGIAAWLPIIIKIAVSYIGYPGPSTPPPFLNYLFWAVGAFFLVYIIGAVGVLKLRKWGRTLSITMDVLVVLVYFQMGITQRAFESFVDLFTGKYPYYNISLLAFVLPMVVLPVIFIYYFCKPSIKEQFK